MPPVALVATAAEAAGNCDVAIGFALALDAFRWGLSAAFTLLLGWTSVGWLMALAFKGPFVVSFDRD